MAWVLLYSHEADGRKKMGSLEALRDAVRAGRPVRLVTGASVPDSVGDVCAIDADYVWISGSDVVAQNNRHVSVKTLDPPLFQLDSYWYMQMFSTSGHAHAIRWSVGSHNMVAANDFEVAIMWYAQS